MRRFMATLINIIAAIVAIGTLCIIQMEFPQGDIIGILNSPAFEKSSDFNNILNERINEIFKLIQLKNCFEKDGKLNYDIIMAETLDQKGVVKKWTIGDCLDEATKHGLYIDPSYDVALLEDKNAIPFDRNKSYNFMFKTYPSKSRTGASFEEEFLTEFMTCLSDYYKAKRDLSEKGSNLDYIIYFYDSDSNIPSLEYKNTNKDKIELLDSNAYVFLSSKENVITSNLDQISSQTLKNCKLNNPHPDKDFSLYISIDTTYPKADAFAEKYKTYTYYKSVCAMLITIIVTAALVYIISLFLVLIFILGAKKSVDESQRLIYNIPTELHVSIYLVFTVALIFFIRYAINTNLITTKDLTPVSLYLYILAIYCTTLILFAVLSAKYVDDTLMPVSLSAIKANTESGYSILHPQALFAIIFIPIAIFLAVSIYLIYLSTLSNSLRMLIIGIILLFSTIGFVIYLIILHNAFNKAIDIQVKANDMRTSLIANVSHDIKTPLTSILNYTNLMTSAIEKPGKSFKKDIAQYSEIIINKSNRLNELINDLIFDSKVSSGNVELKMEKLNLNAFLNQVIAEFEYKLKENNLKIIFNSNIEDAIINADSSQLYRVFQNLFSNIYKYALENSRVYIDLQSQKSKIIITLKNIQKEKLEVSVDALTDRFVRGNKSRNTEGFGLGLSISENLIKSMDGKLEISNIRDEFITKITFVAYEA